MNVGQIVVDVGAHDSVCVISVSGELSLVTAQDFSALAARALATSSVPVVVDVSGLEFMDCHGARALARVLRAVPQGAMLRGCSPMVRRLLAVLPVDLPVASSAAAEGPRLPSRALPVDPMSRGEALVTLTRVTRSSSRQSATYASGVMSRLAATYCELALNSRYRGEGKSDDRGRLLALSARARDLSRQYLRNAASGAG